MVRGIGMVINFIEANTLLVTALTPSTAFTVSSSTGTAITVNAAVVHSTLRAVSLFLDREVAETETLTVSYTKPESGGVQDVAGNYAANFSEKPVLHAEDTPPVLSSAVVNANQLVLSFDDANQLADPYRGPAGDAFAVLVGGNAIAVTATAVDGAAKTVTLTLSTPVVHGQSVTVAYTDPTTYDDSNAIQDVLGNDVASFAATAVTNNTGVSETTPPVFHSATANRDKLVINYTDQNNLDDVALSGTGGFTVDINDSSGRAVERFYIKSAVVNAIAKTVTLTFEGRITIHGESLSVSYTKPASGNVVQDAAGNHAANFQRMAVTNITPVGASNTSPPEDTTPPVFSSAAVAGNRLVISYTDVNSLDPVALAGNAGYAVNTAAGTAAITVSSAVVNATAKTVT
ncbi:SwmB domain-containing protein, partial [Verminephrobacter aporrectodeae]